MIAISMPPRTLLFLCLMVVVGLNLRPALSSVAPLLTRLQAEAGISPLGAGLLTTLPVLFLGLCAPFAPWLSKRLGSERALSLALLLLATGLVIRGMDQAATLFIGASMAGGAIGIGGTLLPALAKRELPESADLVTGLYTMALCLGGAIGAGLSVPLTLLLGSWQVSLMSWSLLALFGLVLWHPLMVMRPSSTTELPNHTSGVPLGMLLHHPLTWAVMVYMGFQSSLAYIVFGWLPALLVERGYSESEAGFAMGVSIIFQISSALAAPWLARFGRDQRLALLIVQGVTASGVGLLLLAPVSWQWPGVALLGLGQGASFSLALTLLVLRTANARLSGQLSGLVQGGGYTLASLGPLAVGGLLQSGAGIVNIVILLLAILLICCALAMYVGRNLRLHEYKGRVETRTDPIGNR